MNRLDSPSRFEPPTAPPGVGARAGRRRARRRRITALALVILWIGPVTFGPAGSLAPLLGWGAPPTARAGASLVAPGEAAVLDPGAKLKLRLRDGSSIEGRFLGRALLDSAHYAMRFAAHTDSDDYVPFVLGETLRVSLRDGRERTAAFAGYGERSLLVSGREGLGDMRVPVEFIRAIRHADGRPEALRTLSRALRKGSLPSAEALVIEDLRAFGSPEERWANALRVPVSDIRESSLGLEDGRSVPVTLVLGVLTLTLVVLIILAMRSPPPSNDCGVVVPTGFAQGAQGYHLTTRAFDLERGCFEGDALAEGGPWPEPAASRPASALVTP